MGRRMERVNELLREEISKLLIHGVKDPRLAAVVTITQVDTSVDLQYAKVFTSVLGTETEKQETLKGLHSASGFLRHELRHRLSLKAVPQLRFLLDESMERAAHVLDVMRQVSDERPPADA